MEIRITPTQKKRWEEEAIRDGAEYLGTWARDMIEKCIRARDEQRVLPPSPPMPNPLRKRR